MKTTELTIEDLANQSGLPLRTLRFYIQEGILQGPDTRGKFARYSQQHLDRIELIRRLKDLRTPINEIKQMLENISEEELHQLLKYQNLVALQFTNLQTNQLKERRISEPGKSALDYIQNIFPDIAKDASADNRMTLRSPLAQIAEGKGVKRSRQETWRRIVISEGIEINIREPRNRDEEINIEKLVKFLQNLS